MPSLAELQRSTAAALLAESTLEQEAIVPWFRSAAARGLRVHRNTVLAACVRSLQLSYPALERWLGTETFEAAALIYVRHCPPAAAALALYGEGFGASAAHHTGSAQRPLTRAIAVFDWLFERVTQSEPGFQRSIARSLEGGSTLTLAPSLCVHETGWPVDTLREQLLAGEGIVTIDSCPLQLALWRGVGGVHVRRIHACTARLLRALCAGALWERALETAAQEAARAGLDAGSLGLILEHELLQAGYSRLQ